MNKYFSKDDIIYLFVILFVTLSTAIASIIILNNINTVEEMKYQPCEVDYEDAVKIYIPTQAVKDAVSLVDTEITENEAVDDNCIKIESQEIYNLAGNAKFTTNELTIDADTLTAIYNEEVESPVWDDKAKINITNTLWYFLRDQGVDEINAAAIIGCIYAEGDFGQEQASYKIIDNIRELNKVLGAGHKGYGIVQWTFWTRQYNLLQYYNTVDNLEIENWDTVRICAECATLLEEVRGFDIFDDLSYATNIEDAVGRFACQYEAYGGYAGDWSKTNGTYKLVRSNSGGSYRLSKAKKIYEYYTSNNTLMVAGIDLSMVAE